MPKTILIIDDEKTIRWSLAEAIAAGGYDTVDAETAADGVAKFRDASPDLVLLDMKLPDGSGLDVLKMVKAEDPSVPVVMMTAYAEVETAVEAMKLGAYDFVAKPYSVDKLRVTISNALENQRLRSEIAYLRSGSTGNAFFKQFIGRSPAMVEIFDKIKKI
ncbi:MAG TPA: response regulator, partial [Candidatus Krumholzibacteria bacterium]|nr:response regulator [Candidatus Krumholzibacteria bacterium]